MSHEFNFTPNGPIIAKNHAFIDGKLVAEEGTNTALCRCGRSKNKPLCDGSHKMVTPPWSSSNTAPPPDIEDVAGKSSSPVVGGGGGTKNSAYPNEDIESTMTYIKELARDGLKTHHGPMTAMGVPRTTLPLWDDIQLITAQLATKPLLDDVAVTTKLTIGKHCSRPLTLDVPIIVSDMSFGALSKNAKLALSKGAELAGTGICSGEGGSLPEERQLNSKYFYEVASAFFGYDENIFKNDVNIKAIHFKGGQAAKTGTGGHLSANKVTPEIAKVRKLEPNQDAISPATFKHLHTQDDFKQFAARLRHLTNGVPIGFKISAQHIEQDIQFAIDANCADYLILDGRGGATGAAPSIFRDNISVPTIPALARATKYLESIGKSDEVTLFVTGGLRTPADFIKALCLGADGIAVSNSAIQSIGCIAARICNTNTCPSGVATQDPVLASLINIDKSAKQLANFLNASKHLMEVMARACGHNDVTQFNTNDITTWKRDMAYLSGIQYGGVVPL